MLYERGSRERLNTMPRVLFSVAAVALATAGRGVAQSVHGRLLEAETGRPIPSAQLTLMNERGNAAGAGFSGSDGRFEIIAPRPGRYLLIARRLGFRPRSDPIQVGEGGVDLELRLAPIPVTLDPVTVEAEVNARYLDLVGFYTRQRADFGHFITRDEIEGRRPVHVSDVLNTVPGVRLVPDGGSVGKVRIQFRGAVVHAGAVCEPRVFIDGLIAIRGDSRPATISLGQEVASDLTQEDPRAPEPVVDDVVDPNDVEAIEVYRSGVQVPAEFGGMSAFTRCGAIVIWTRRGR